MRNIKTIEADIAKLQLELALEKDRQDKMESAVHILQNLGWTRVRGEWVRPAVKMKTLDKDTMTHIKAGDFCNSTETSSLWYVRKVAGNICLCSHINRIDPNGILLANNNVAIKSENLKVINAKDYMGYTNC